MLRAATMRELIASFRSCQQAIPWTLCPFKVLRYNSLVSFRIPSVSCQACENLGSSDLLSSCSPGQVQPDPGSTLPFGENSDSDQARKNVTDLPGHTHSFCGRTCWMGNL